MYFKSFEAVFSAIDQGLCQYGILPIENSTAGSVNKVYDLMIEHNFSIVRTFRLKIDHNLLVNPGTNLADIKEVYSHEQAINQCGNFLHSLPGVNVIPVDNTALAAQMVAQSGRKDVAALSSRACAELYGLARLYTLGINVTKLESRPIPDREFEFMFYFDLETSIYSEEFVQLMCELDEMCEEFKYLGSYTEVV